MHFLYYWLNDQNVVESTEDPDVAEAALKQFKHVLASNKGDIDLGLLLNGKEQKA